LISILINGYPQGSMNKGKLTSGYRPDPIHLTDQRKYTSGYLFTLAGEAVLGLRGQASRLAEMGSLLKKWESETLGKARVEERRD